MRTSENSVNAKFAEFPFRNCLENSWKASGRCVVGARRGRRVVYLPLLAALQAPLRDSFRISKQFRKGNSPKFAFGALLVGECPARGEGMFSVDNSTRDLSEAGTE